MLWRRLLFLPRSTSLKASSLLPRSRACAVRRFFATISGVEVCGDKRTVSVEFGRKEKHVYHAVWLKHLCHCPECRDPHSGQSHHSPEALRSSFKLSSAVNNGNSLGVTWEEDERRDHQGTFPADWLRENAYGEDVWKKISLNARPVTRMDKLSEFDYRELKGDSLKRLDWLLRVYEDGATLLRNVPTEPGYTVKVAEFICALNTGIYGDYFDIVTSSTAQDSSYSDKALTFHNDEPYFESAPGITVLLCMENDDCVEGGLSMVVDAFGVAEAFRKEYPDEFQVLATVPVIFGRTSEELSRPVNIFYRRPHISLGYNNEITSVSFTNTMQHGVCASHDMVEPYYHARWRWYNFVSIFKPRHTVRLSSGDCLVVNNHRVFHNRSKITLNGGRRLLSGSYVNIDLFKSEVLAQCRLFGRPFPKARIGNQDYIC